MRTLNMIFQDVVKVPFRGKCVALSIFIKRKKSTKLSKNLDNKRKL